MNPDYAQKSSVDQIRKRFDADVERFSNLETGQSAAMDAPLCMDLIARAAVASTSPIQRVLDLGCGAGNNTLKLREVLGRDFDVDLLDISRPMVDRAVERVSKVNEGRVQGVAGDFRDVDLPEEDYDVILAAAVLHHLRDDDDWEAAFRKIHRLLRPGGGVWITDLVCQDDRQVGDLMWRRYSDYLEQLGGSGYRDTVLQYIEEEDSPRSVTYQLDLMKKVGFRNRDVLHKTSVFCAFGAVK